MKAAYMNLTTNMGHGLNFEHTQCTLPTYLPKCDTRNSALILANVATAMLSGVYENFPIIEAKLAQNESKENANRESLTGKKCISDYIEYTMQVDDVHDEDDDEEIIVDDDADVDTTLLPGSTFPVVSEDSSPIKSDNEKRSSGEKKPYRCQYCKYLTDRKNNLKRHVITMHEKCGKILECCDVVFANKSALREHVIAFHRSGYDCRICGRTFCRKALLKRHVTVHSGQKDYVCSICGYATSHKSNLDRHKRRHSTKDEGIRLPDHSPNTSLPSPPGRYPYEQCYVGGFSNNLEAPLLERHMRFEGTPPHLPSDRSVAPSMPPVVPMGGQPLSPPYGPLFSYSMLTDSSSVTRSEFLRYYSSPPRTFDSFPQLHTPFPSRQNIVLHRKKNIFHKRMKCYSEENISKPIPENQLQPPSAIQKNETLCKKSDHPILVHLSQIPVSSNPDSLSMSRSNIPDMSPLLSHMTGSSRLPSITPRKRLVPGLYPCIHCREVFIKQIELDDHAKEMCWLKTTNKTLPQLPITIAVRNNFVTNISNKSPTER